MKNIKTTDTNKEGVKFTQEEFLRNCFLEKITDLSSDPDRDSAKIEEVTTFFGKQVKEAFSEMNDPSGILKLVHDLKAKISSMDEVEVFKVYVQNSLLGDSSTNVSE